MANLTGPLHAPWGYEYMSSQEQVNSTWRWQILQCMTLGGYVWDIILSIPEDWEFTFYRRFNYVTCIYVINRLSATLCLVGYFILTVTTPPSCEELSVIVPTSEAITLFTSCALLVIRVWVLYRDQIYVTMFMVALLFPGPIINIVAWAPQKSFVLPNKSGCSFWSRPPSWQYVPFVFQAVFDLLVFLLCLAKLVTRSDLTIKNIRHDPIGTRMKIRHEFLKGGFVYYVPNVIIQIITLVFLIRKFDSLQNITTPCATAVASAQSLRITRRLWKLGKSRQEPDDIIL